MTEIFGFFCALIIGMTLGLIGGGGSILTIPVLVYIFGINPVLGTAYSLFVVGSSALIGSLTYFRKKMVDYKAAIVFALPSFIAVFFTRKYLLPSIPDHMSIIGFEISKGGFIMVFFSLIMFMASYSMIRGKKDDVEVEDENAPMDYFMIISQGIVVGVLTGLVGAGGGFLIIPAMVLFGKIPIKIAIGTSLLVIAANSLSVFFIVDTGQHSIDWFFLLSFTGLSIIGIFIGSYLNNFISGAKLKRGFGVFVLLMAIYIFSREIIFV
jgi:uncharacterized protein